MELRTVSRRQLLGWVNLAAGTSLLSGCGQMLEGSPSGGKTTSSERADSLQSTGQPGKGWRYFRLDPDAVATEAYRLMPQGGCMYGLFASIMVAMARVQGEPYLSFPIHMMKYGEGGVGLWGSLCGTLNGGAAIVGLFVPDKSQREQLIAELFAWYEATKLPIYRPHETEESADILQSAAGSVLCHVSVGKWCKFAGEEIGSPYMKERCRRLTADTAAKTVELLNANLREPHRFAGLTAEVRSCISCHGARELRDAMGQMQCESCHQQLSKKHPSIPAVPSEATADPPTKGP